ncbi:MAG: hypothetical protein JWM93_3559 [Frankiales bacterium]|nr:hypothetical protein [Frankiales bacterium]
MTPLGEPSDADRFLELLGDEPAARQALGAIFDRHARSVYAYCARRCATAQDAEDAMSAAFLEVWRTRSRTVLVDDSLRPWLLGVAANVLRTQRRSGLRHSSLLTRVRSLGGPSVDDPADEVGATLDAVAAARRVTAAISRLPAKERAVADLCLLGEMTTAHAALVLGVPDGTVKSRLARTKSTLRALLRSSDIPGHDADAGHVPVGRALRVSVATEGGAPT